MAPEELEAVLKPYRDAGEDSLLSDERKKQEAFYRHQECPTCGAGGMVPYFVGMGHAYGAHEILPRRGLQCERCGCKYDPHSRLVLSPGNLAKAAEDIKAGQMPGIGGDLEEISSE